MPRKPFITTASEAIDYLGGTFKVAELFGIDPRVVSNWRMRGLPPDTYAAMAPALAARGVVFSPQLFAQRAIRAAAPSTNRIKRQSKGLPTRKLRADLARLVKSQEEQV